MFNPMPAMPMPQPGMGWAGQGHQPGGIQWVPMRMGQSPAYALQVFNDLRQILITFNMKIYIFIFI